MAASPPHWCGLPCWLHKQAGKFPCWLLLIPPAQPAAPWPFPHWALCLLLVQSGTLNMPFPEPSTNRASRWAWKCPWLSGHGQTCHAHCSRSYNADWTKTGWPVTPRTPWLPASRRHRRGVLKEPLQGGPCAYQVMVWKWRKPRHSNPENYHWELEEQKLQHMVFVFCRNLLENNL